MYGIMGLAVLAKGPVGMILPTAVIGMFLLVMRLPELPDPAQRRGIRGLLSPSFARLLRDIFLPLAVTCVRGWHWR